MFKKINRNQKGFTLIELLIVIAILGILAAVAIPSVSHYMKSATVTAGNAEVASITTAITAYEAENGGANPTDVTVASSNLGLASYLGSPIIGTYTMVSGVITGVTYKTLATSNWSVATTPTPATPGNWH